MTAARKPAPAPALRIGTGGIPASTPAPGGSELGIRRIRELGLTSMELEWVNGVQLGPERAAKIRAAAESCDVALTVHAPYYVNLNSRDPEKREASLRRLFETARLGSLCGAHSFTFHAAFYHDDPPEAVHRTVRSGLEELKRRAEGAGLPIEIRPELTGRPSQYGALEELLRLSAEVPGIHPCIDFSHHHARGGGGQNGYESFARTLDAIRRALGKKALRRLHMHVSGIEYGPGGERRHLPLPDADFRYRELMRALVDHQVGGWVVCESPVLEKDALLLLGAWRRATAAARRERAADPAASRRAAAAGPRA